MARMEEKRQTLSNKTNATVGQKSSLLTQASQKSESTGLRNSIESSSASIGISKNSSKASSDLTRRDSFDENGSSKNEFATSETALHPNSGSNSCNSSFRSSSLQHRRGSRSNSSRSPNTRSKIITLPIFRRNPSFSSDSRNDGDTERMLSKHGPSSSQSCHSLDHKSSTTLGRGVNEVTVNIPDGHLRRQRRSDSSVDERDFITRL